MDMRHLTKPNAEFDPEGMDSTARDYYLVMLTNGRIPQRVSGGKFDGLAYFEIELDGVTYWITEQGIFYPLTT